MPWNEGKHPLCLAFMQFLGQWARRLPWQQVGAIFQASWASVCRSVEWMVQWGLAHRSLAGVEALGVDEIHVGRGKKSAAFLTVIYQVDAHERRWLWIGQRRTQATLRRGLEQLGSTVCQGIRYVCSDMWKPFRQVIAQRLPQATHVIDRFHVTLNLNKAVDEVRRQESRSGADPGKKLKRMRWSLLRRKSRVRGKMRERLEKLIRGRMKTARAYVLKESFNHFWTYKSVTWARHFLNTWIRRAMKSRLSPMKKAARMLRNHEELILNWIACRQAILTGAVEGLNNKIRVVTKRSYGFRTFHIMEMALYHTLGKLTDPPSTHKFW
jgi:transposase